MLQKARGSGNTMGNLQNQLVQFTRDQAQVKKFAVLKFVKFNLNFLLKNSQNFEMFRLLSSVGTTTENIATAPTAVPLRSQLATKPPVRRRAKSYQAPLGELSFE